MHRLVVLELLERMTRVGWLGPHRVVDQAPIWSGARPWSRRLQLMTLEAIRENQLLGVRYRSWQALASGEQLLVGSTEEVLGALFRGGAVLAEPPPPAWAIAICIGTRPTQIVWLTPTPLIDLMLASGHEA